MSIEKLRPAFTFTEDRFNDLRSVVPEAFADGKINWDTFREALGEHTEDEAQEHFGLFWPGKREARRLASLPSKGSLVPQPGQGVNAGTTRNIFIEGDNLEVLKLLQKSYAGQVKMIYIDPPYNTGEDRVYMDNFTESFEAYMKSINNIDEQGRILTTNSRADGRFHTKWLNMIYPRLLLAHKLLRDDGVIFVSIDDNEVHNLRQIMGEIFGEENFEGHIHWRRRHNQPNDPTKMIGIVAEHILAFSKSKTTLKESGVGKVALTGSFSNPDNDPRGSWASKPWKVGSGQSGTRYTITLPSGRVMDEEWMGDINTYNRLRNDNRIVFPSNGDGLPRKKYFKFEREEEGQCATNWWSSDIFGNNQEASDELTELFRKKQVFSNPKPVNLLKNLIAISNAQKDDLIMDFFSGSSTLGHATFDINLDEKENLRFILVQYPELLREDDKDQEVGYSFCLENNLKPTVAEIGKERIRRVIQKMQVDQKDQRVLESNVDLGFKVFCLDHSNFKYWQPHEGDDITQLGILFDLFETSLVASWKNEDLLTEILLLQGFPLDSHITYLDTFHKNNVLRIHTEFCVHELFVSLDKKIEEETIRKLDMREQDIFVCLDTAMIDQAKIELADRCNLKVI